MAALVLVLVYGAGQWQGRTAASANAEAKQLRQEIEDIRERNADDAETRNLSDFELCVRDIGSVPECDSLR